jgi:hypothetical protein
MQAILQRRRLLLALLAVAIAAAIAAIWIVAGGQEHHGKEAQAQVTVRLVGAGDIATNANGDQQTAQLVLDRLDDALDTTPITMGDNAYSNGSASDFDNKYDPSWGQFKCATRPTPGNHDYFTANAAGYKGYFDECEPDRATPNGTDTYYAYNYGDWRVYAMDSEISMTTSSAQYQWLENDLEANARECMVAYWHKPIVSSDADHGNDNNLNLGKPMWALLDSYGADLVLAGHAHDYERFNRMNSQGQNSSAGMRQIIVGTGGVATEGFLATPHPQSAKRITGSWGIIEVELRPTEYRWEFEAVPGSPDTASDVGTATCVGNREIE